jgi:O-antigen/teichoic acid export membrane protein
MSTPGKNIFWLTFSRVTAMVLLLVAYLALFRYLGEFGTGQHQFVLSYVTIFSVIVDFGIQQYIIKKMSEEPSEVKKYFQNFLVVELVLSFLIYCSMIAIAFYNQYDTVVIQAIALAGLGMVVNALTYPFLSVMSAFGDLKKVAMINFLNSLINVIIIFLTIYFHKYVVFLVSNQVIFGITGIILYYHFVKKHLPEPDVFGALRRVDFNLLTKILKASFPFALLVGFSTVYNRIDIILIQHTLGFEQTGIYAAAYKFFDLMAFFPSVVSFSLYPLFASLMAKQAIIEVRGHVEEYLRLMIALALPMAVGGSLLARPLITILAGERFSGGAPVLAVIVWAVAILFIYVVANSLVISQLTRFAVAITGVNVLVNVVGNIILLPRIGILGAAIMTVVSELLQGVFYFYFVRKLITSFNIFSLFVKPILASAVMGLVIWNVRGFDLAYKLSLVPDSLSHSVFNVFWLISLGGAIYFLVLFILKFFRKQDLLFIKHLAGVRNN